MMCSSSNSGGVSACCGPAHRLGDELEEDEASGEDEEVEEDGDVADHEVRHHAEADALHELEGQQGEGAGRKPGGDIVPSTTMEGHSQIRIS